MKSQNIIIALVFFGAASVNPGIAGNLCNAEVEETDSSKDTASVTHNLSTATWCARLYNAINPKIYLLANAIVTSEERKDSKVAIKIAPERKIKEATIIKSSGDNNFDVICLAGIKSLEGNSVIDLPKSNQGVLPTAVLSFSLGPNNPSHPSKVFSQSQIELLMKLSISEIKKQLNADIDHTSNHKISEE